MPKAKKTRVVKEHALFKSHAGPGNHLCELVSTRQMDKVATLSNSSRTPSPHGTPTRTGSAPLRARAMADINEVT